MAKNDIPCFTLLLTSVFFFLLQYFLEFKVIYYNCNRLLLHLFSFSLPDPETLGLHKANVPSSEKQQLSWHKRLLPSHETMNTLLHPLLTQPINVQSPSISLKSTKSVLSKTVPQGTDSICQLKNIYLKCRNQPQSTITENLGKENGRKKFTTNYSDKSLFYLPEDTARIIWIPDIRLVDLKTQRKLANEQLTA